MLRSRAVLCCLLLVLCAGAFFYFVPNTEAQRKMRNPDVVGTEWNASAEFAANQGGTTGVWNYGYTANPTSDTFVQLPNVSSRAGCTTNPGTDFHIWEVSGNGPHMGQNKTGTTLICSGVRLPADAIYMHPGEDGRRTVLRWTAPQAGTFQVTGVLEGVNLSGQGVTDFRILKNETGTPLFSGTNSALGSLPFNFTVTVAVGDRIDFSLGWGNGTWNSDGSGLAVTIGDPVVACQAPAANQQVWLTGENSDMDVQSVNANSQLVGDAFYTNSGKVGRAFTLDGNGDYVRIDDNAAQKPTNQLTAEGWFKFDSLGGIPTLIAKPLLNDTKDSYTMWYQNGNIRIGYTQSDGTFTSYDTGFSPVTGVFNHYAMVLNTDDAGAGANTLKLYVNGIEAASGPAGLPVYYNGINDASPVYPLLIGADFEANVPTFFMDGDADEVSIYGRALTQPEIFDIFQQGSFGKCSPPTCAQPPSGMVSWWQGENNAVDSRSNNHGTLVNGAGFSTGKVGQAFNLAAASNAYVEIPDNAGLNATTATWQFWMRTSQAPPINGAGVIGKADAGSSFNGVVVFVDAGRIGVQIKTTNNTGALNILSPAVVNDGVYHHIAVRFQSGGAVELFVDGVSVGSGSAPNFSFGANPLRIGRTIDTYWAPYDGSVDEFSIFERQLTNAEIQSIYNAGQSGTCRPIGLNAPANLVGWWSGGGDARDLSAHANHGTLVNGASFGVGKVGQSFSFNGSNQYVLIGDPVPPVLQIQNEISLEAWIYVTQYPTTPDGLAMIMGSQYDPNFAGASILLDARTNPDGQSGIPSGHIHFQIGGQGTWHVTNTQSTVPLNQWVHIAATRKANEDGRVYFNGVLQPSVSAPWNGVVDYTNAWFAIGQQKNVNRAFNGKIDEPSIYSRALSASEVQGIYQAQDAGKLKSRTVSVGPPPQPLEGVTSPAVTTVQLSDATVIFPNDLVTGGTVTESGLDLGLLPPLPASATFTGLAYDISTTAVPPAGPNAVQVCFNVPALASIPIRQLKILHLENGAWVDRSAAVQSQSYSALCTTGMSSLSPFVIVRTVLTASEVSVSGRVVTADGRGITGATVRLTDSFGKTRTFITTRSGAYRFTGVDSGQTVSVEVVSRRFTFVDSPRFINLTDNVTGADFTGLR